ncbi:MAG: Alpha-L-fucosidase [Sphingobacterium sp.]|jgi:hypothetical protein|nr:Alpha-L-fucosidase [Sphingobacterium sp.]
MLVIFTVKGQESVPMAYNPALKWFTDVRFGLFIHWDMSSVAGTEISWDWYHPHYGIGDNKAYINFMNGQLRELLSNYGKIDILWWDSYGVGDLENFGRSVRLMIW